MKEMISPGEKRIYAFQYQAVLHRPCKIYEIPPGSGELGYTQANGDVFLAGRHALIAKLSEEKQAFFRCGVFVHEMMHQCYTDFPYFHQKLDEQKDEQDKQIFSLFVNLVEDPAIEYFAPLKVGGYLLAALRFSIRHIYQNAPSLEECVGAFEQFVNALIMFGDMGLLKGEITDPDAKEMFQKLIPSFNKAVTNPSSKERIDAAEQWMIITRPLWKKENKESLEEISKKLEKSGMTSSAGDPAQSGPSETPEEEPGETPEAKRRKALAKAAGTEEAPEKKGEASGKAEGEENGEGGSGENGEKQSFDELLKSFAKEAEESAEGEAEDEAVSRQRSDFWQAVETEGKKASQNEEVNTLDLPVPIPKANGRGQTELKVLNRRPETEEGDEDSYKSLCARVSRDTRMLTTALKNLFRADYEEQIHSTSGKYCLKRDLSHTSVKVFDKKKDRKNTDDLAVVILVDISGSMQGNKIALARSCAVTMAETFAALKIPCYILGFTADGEGAQVVQEHYVTWNNTAKERVSLVKIRARYNNDDAYSIRYATQLLKKKPAEHKILFVLSDGAPACRRYQRVNGIEETSMAIREAQKTGLNVFGIGIGVSLYEELKEMYRGDYINVRDNAELTGTLARQLKRTIRRF